MTEEHDKSHRLLFSHPAMIIELIRRFVGGEWIDRLDFSTLVKASERDVSPQLLRREKDLLWKLKIRPHEPGGSAGWFYVYLHLEFQSEPQRFMALRMLTYKVLLYEDLIRRGALTENGLLPPVLSLVLYNGKRAWNEARSLEELVEPLPGFEGSAQPEGFSLLDYRLIEERAYSLSELEQNPGPASTLFRLEQSRDLDELKAGVQQLLHAIPGAGDRSLREAFATWLSTVLIPTMEPGAAIPEIRDLTEVDSMLQQTVAEWRDGWLAEGMQKGMQKGRQEGRQEGREEGRQEGVRKGEALVLLRQAEKKFGPMSAELQVRIESASSRQLLLWTDRILTAESLDQLFA